jgi:hypothetical protein
VLKRETPGRDMHALTETVVVILLRNRT